jgi:hypothetical protein
MNHAMALHAQQCHMIAMAAFLSRQAMVLGQLRSNKRPIAQLTSDGFLLRHGPTLSTPGLNSKQFGPFRFGHHARAGMLGFRE